MSLRELSIMTESVLETDPEMLARFEAHDRVVKNPANGLYSYRVCFHPHFIDLWK